MKVFISKNEKNALVRDIRAARRNVDILFYISIIFIPIISYLLFEMNIIKPQKVSLGDLEKSTVLINSNVGQGTAFFINKKQLLTAAHVVEGLTPGDEIEMVLDGGINSSCKLIYVQKDLDFALMECSEEEEIDRYFNLSSNNTLPLYESTIASGYPSGMYQSILGTISSTTFNGDQDYFTIASAGWHGQSGGPVVLKNKPEEVIGIVISGVEGSGLMGILKIDKVLNDNNFLREFDKP